MDMQEFNFDSFIRIWVRISLVLIIVEAYLTVNKIWIRKHEAVVSESVSVSAQLLALATGLPFVGLYVIEGAYEGAISDGVFLLVNLVMIMIGIGFWVEGRRGQGFWQNLKKSLHLERTEAGSLAKDFFRPVGARQVIRILQELAMIDNEFDVREKEFIEAFARKWGIDLAELGDPAAVGAERTTGNFTHLRKLVQDYIGLGPPAEQAKQLRDVLTSLAGIDQNVSEDEELILSELLGLIDDYASGTTSAKFSVYIAPQTPTQETAILETMPGLSKQHRLGGEVFEIGHFYSRAYADMVCEWYRETGYLTITEGVGD